MNPGSHENSTCSKERDCSAIERPTPLLSPVRCTHLRRRGIPIQSSLRSHESLVQSLRSRTHPSSLPFRNLSVPTKQTGLCILSAGHQQTGLRPCASMSFCNAFLCVLRVLARDSSLVPFSGLPCLEREEPQNPYTNVAGKPYMASCTRYASIRPWRSLREMSFSFRVPHSAFRLLRSPFRVSHSLLITHHRFHAIRHSLFTTHHLPSTILPLDLRIPRVLLWHVC